METEIIENMPERFLTKFEEESLKDYWNESDFEDKSEIAYKEWYESMSWLSIDEIMKSYTNEE